MRIIPIDFDPIQDDPRDVVEPGWEAKETITLPILGAEEKATAVRNTFGPDREYVFDDNADEWIFALKTMESDPMIAGNRK